MNAPAPKIYLASTSPRRQELLLQQGLRFQTIAPQVDETPKRSENGRAMVGRLAKAKARAALVGVNEFPAIVIAADTTVVAPGGKLILGKPEDMAEAHAMLTRLQGKTHVVYTGYCILGVASAGAKPRERAQVVASRVTFRKMNAAQIASYAALVQPLDKAGAYAAQGAGMSIIDSIQGSYANVVGLPISQVLADLEKHFGYSLFSWIQRP